MSDTDEADGVTERAEPILRRPTDPDDMLLDVRVVIPRDDQCKIGATFGPSVHAAADQIELLRYAARLLTDSAANQERLRSDE